VALTLTTAAVGAIDPTTGAAAAAWVLAGTAVLLGGRGSGTGAGRALLVAGPAVAIAASLALLLDRATSPVTAPALAAAALLLLGGVATSLPAELRLTRHSALDAGLVILAGAAAAAVLGDDHPAATAGSVGAANVVFVVLVQIRVPALHAADAWRAVLSAGGALTAGIAAGAWALSGSVPQDAASPRLQLAVTLGLLLTGFAPGLGRHRGAGSGSSPRGLLGGAWQLLPALAAIGIVLTGRLAGDVRGQLLAALVLVGFGAFALLLASQRAAAAGQLERLRRSERDAGGRARQKEAIAELGRFALEPGSSPDDLMQAACERIADVLDVELVKVLELQPGRRELILRAGVGWRRGLVGASVPTDVASQAGYTLSVGEPVVVDDLARERRFRGPALLQEHGVVSGLSVAIGRNGSAYGVLGAHTRAPREFTRDDTVFFEAVAALLAQAVRRDATEQALLRSEERFRAIAEASPTGIVFCDADGIVVYANPADARMTGLGTARRKGAHWLAAVAPEEGERARADWDAAAAAGLPWEGSGRYLRPDGSVLCWEARTAPVVGAGAAVGHVCTIQDVSARQASEQALRAAETRYRSLVETLPLAVYVDQAEPVGTSIYASPRIEEVTGYAPEAWASDPGLFERVLHPDDRDRVLELHRSAAAGDGGLEAEYRIVRADGRVAWIADTASYLPAGHGEPARLQGYLLDVTERREAEDELRKLAAVVETSNEFIGIARPDGQVVFVNPAGRALVGLDPDSAVEHLRIGDFCTPEAYALLETELLPALFGTGAWAGEISFRHFETGADVAVEMSAFTIGADEHGAPLYIANVSRSLHERRALEEQLRHSQKLEAVGRLAGGVAHDFNNLLTVILGNADALDGELAADHPSRPYVGEIAEAGRRAADVTKQLLAFSRRQVLEPRVVDPAEVVGGIEAILRRLAGPSVTLLVDAPAGLGHVRIDPGQLEQAVVNLAVNGCDAMPRGGTLDVTVSRDGNQAVLVVSDTGDGIDDATRDQIFEPFFTTKPEGKGTGLGLAMVHGFVEQSGGGVEVDSEPGRGTRFTIRLPLVDAPVEPREAARPVELTGEVVLLVEDEDAVRAVTRRLLEQLGCEVLEASNARDALALAAARPGEIDVLLTDLRMPSATGSELARRIAVAQPQVRVVLMSGYTADAALADVDFLPKPFTRAELAERLRRDVEGPA
jgi:PAS domain S-box-containing protein